MPPALDKRYQPPPFFGIGGRGGAPLGRQRNQPQYPLNYLRTQSRDRQAFSLAGSRSGALPHEVNNFLRQLHESRSSNLDTELRRERYAHGRGDPGYGQSYGRGHNYDNGRGLSNHLAEELAYKERQNAFNSLLSLLASSRKNGQGNSRQSSHDHGHESGHGHGRDCGHSNHCDYGGGHNCQVKHNHHVCGHSHCNDNGETDPKTKDVALRGKAYKIRRTFLADMGKFEHELIKLVDKRSEEELPDSVIQLLVDFINKESCETKNAVDIVGLSLLASTLGYTSAINGAIEQLKEVSAGHHIGRGDLTKICGMITMSGKVDEGLKSWLKNFLLHGHTLEELWHSQAFQELNHNHPEVGVRLRAIVGVSRTEDELDFPVF